MKQLQQVHAYILAGGSSSRFGSDKALLNFQGRRFIDRIISTCARLFGAVFVVGRSYSHSRLDGSMPDRITGIGPMGGVLTALEHAATDGLFLVGVDYPLADPGVMLHLGRAFLRDRGAFEGLIPLLPDGRHPLFAFYRKTCLPAVHACISEGCYKVVCIAGRLPVRFLDLSMGELDPAVLRRCFINVNRRGDYESLFLPFE